MKGVIWPWRTAARIRWPGDCADEIEMFIFFPVRLDREYRQSSRVAPGQRREGRNRSRMWSRGKLRFVESPGSQSVPKRREGPPLPNPRLEDRPFELFAKSSGAFPFVPRAQHSSAFSGAQDRR